MYKAIQGDERAELMYKLKKYTYEGDTGLLMFNLIFCNEIY